MLIIKKEMKNEKVEYVASNEETLDVIKNYFTLDGAFKKAKPIDLREVKIEGRYWYKAKDLFDFLVNRKGYSSY